MERTEIKSYTERTWQSAFTRMTDGRHLMTVVYSGHSTQQEAEACARRHADRYDDVVSIDVTPIDHGADGDFGSATEAAVLSLQENNRLDTDGVYGPKTAEMVEKLLKLLDNEPGEDSDKPEIAGSAIVTAKSVWTWTAPPDCGGVKTKVVHKGDEFPIADQNYVPLIVDGGVQWINRKYLTAERS